MRILTSIEVVTFYKGMLSCRIFDMLDIDREAFNKACLDFDNGRHAFIHQFNDFANVKISGQMGDSEKNVHKRPRPINRIFQALKGKCFASSEHYQYGITFVSEKYVRRHWAKWFHVDAVRHGAIHDFQDIVVLRAKN